MATASPPSGSLTRWILPVALFVVIVGAIAWVSQNLPKGSGQATTTTTPPSGKEALRFLLTKSVWDENDREYVKEFETGTEGYYDFPFVNPGTTPVTLGFFRSSCDCSQLKVAVFEPDVATHLADLHAKNPTKFPTDPKWEWTKLSVNEKEGVQIPPGGGGVARLQWDGRKGDGSILSLRIQMWMHPAGKLEARTFETLEANVKMSDPVKFHPTRVPLGIIVVGGQEKGRTIAYSTTRKELDLRVNPDKDDPLHEFQIVKLDEPAIKALEAEFAEDKKGIRIQCAYRIDTTVRTQKDGHMLDLGHFSREMPLVMLGYAHGLHPPTVTGYVRGEIDVGTTEDSGKINLRNFSMKDGVQRAVPLWSDGPAELTLESVYPLTIGAKLTRNAKESTPSRSRWTLDVTVPPGGYAGTFSEDAVIILRSNATPPRRIRIPIVGTAEQR